MHFVKMFSTMPDSTIWQESKDTKLTWITMLLVCDSNGEIHASIPGLAKRVGITTRECQDALKCLMSPDPFSRTKDHEGRRIKEIDGGWFILNYAKYRDTLSAEDKKRKDRERIAAKRADEKALQQEAAKAPPLATDDVKEFE